MKPKLLGPMARMLSGRERAKFSLSTPSLRSILDSVYLRLEADDGSLTGYGGGLERKRWLLDHERNAAKKTPTY